MKFAHPGVGLPSPREGASAGHLRVAMSLISRVTIRLRRGVPLAQAVDSKLQASGLLLARKSVVTFEWPKQ